MPAEEGMTVERWNPWSRESMDLFEKWIQASLLSGIIQDRAFDYEDLIFMINNAERLDVLGDMSRDKALLLMGLWMGRYQGNQDTGWWSPKLYATEDDVGVLKESCQDFIDVADDPNSKPFWETVARLLVAVKNLHPENVT